MPDYVTMGPLADLRWHWGEAYLISGIIGYWRAERRDDGRTLTADDPEKLRQATIADYTAMPVPRDPLPPLAS
jgi:hypothetical protein